MKRLINEGRVFRGGAAVGEAGSALPWFGVVDCIGWGDGLGGGGALAASSGAWTCFIRIACCWKE